MDHEEGEYSPGLISSPRVGHTTSSLRSLTPLLVPSPSPPPPKMRGVSQGLFHVRLCGVNVLAHVRVRVRMHVCVMCLSARC